MSVTVQPWKRRSPACSHKMQYIRPPCAAVQALAGGLVWPGIWRLGHGGPRRLRAGRSRRHRERYHTRPTTVPGCSCVPSLADGHLPVGGHAHFHPHATPTSNPRIKRQAHPCRESSKIVRSFGRAWVFAVAAVRRDPVPSDGVDASVPVIASQVATSRQKGVQKVNGNQTAGEYRLTVVSGVSTPSLRVVTLKRWATT